LCVTSFNRSTTVCYTQFRNLLGQCSISDLDKQRHRQQLPEMGDDYIVHTEAHQWFRPGNGVTIQKYGPSGWANRNV